MIDAKYVVFDLEDFPQGFSQYGPACAHASELASSYVGKEFPVYERTIAFKARVVIDDDAPKCADIAERVK